MPKSIQMRFWIIILCALIVANIFVYRTVSAPRAFEVLVFEVGKGRAVLVQSPSGRTLLVDAGTSAAVLRTLGTALSYWQRSLDAVILTSGDARSASGLRDIQNSYHNSYHIGRIASFGGKDLPYGTSLLFDANASITVLASGIFSISYGATSFQISSSTSPGLYTSNGTIFIKKE